MFQHPLFVPVAVGIVIAGVIFLIVSYRREAKPAEAPPPPPAAGWQVQCPKCSRWKQLQPVRRELLDEQKINLLPGTQHRFIHEYKCPFCGHTWYERYTG